MECSTSWRSGAGKQGKKEGEFVTQSSRLAAALAVGSRVVENDNDKPNKNRNYYETLCAARDAYCLVELCISNFATLLRFALHLAAGFREVCRGLAIVPLCEPRFKIMLASLSTHAGGFVRSWSEWFIYYLLHTGSTTSTDSAECTGEDYSHTCSLLAAALNRCSRRGSRFLGPLLIRLFVLH